MAEAQFESPSPAPFTRLCWLPEPVCPLPLPRSRVCFVVKDPLKALHHSPPSQTDIFLKGSLCCKTRAKENQPAPTPHPQPTPDHGNFHLARLPLWLSQGKEKKVQRSLQWVVAPRAHYQAGVTECGTPVAHPMSNGIETSTLLPLFPSGSSGALRGLLILASNGKCVAMLNPEPPVTARRIEGGRSLCLIYKQCMGETLRAEECCRKNPCGI